MAKESSFQSFARQGFLPLAPDIGMDQLFKGLTHQVSAVVTVCPLDVARLPERPYFDVMRNNTHSTKQNLGKRGNRERPAWLGDLRELEHLARREEIRSKVAAVVAGVGVVGLDGSTVWGEAGLDSLGMVEVRNGVVRAFENAVPLGATALFDYPTLNALVQHIEATLCPPSEVGGVAGHMNVMKTASTEREVVGVVGMSCRFPRGGDGPEAFWQMLAGAVDAATQIPISRMDWRSLFAPASSGGALYTNHGAFIEDAEMFDCGAFHLSPAEAKCLYPHSGR